MDLRNTNAKYERPITYSKKVMANVQKYVKGHGQGHPFELYGTIEKVIRNTYAKYESPTLSRNEL